MGASDRPLAGKTCAYFIGCRFARPQRHPNPDCDACFSLGCSVKRHFAPQRRTASRASAPRCFAALPLHACVPEASLVRKIYVRHARRRAGRPRAAAAPEQHELPPLVSPLSPGGVHGARDPLRSSLGFLAAVLFCSRLARRRTYRTWCLARYAACRSKGCNCTWAERRGAGTCDRVSAAQEASHKHTPTEGAHTCHSRVQLHARLCGPNPSHGAPPALPQRPSPRPGACCTLQALPPQVPAARRQPRRAAADALEDGRLHGECAADDDEGRPDVHPRHLAGPVQTRSLRRTPHQKAPRLQDSGRRD